ncbi:hypothetical protein C8J57DRAFT_1249211 [Mycena rebaudengoi]|nr:hypothetical protein C8J57DRAFT_1249211 [Mycena rebaudengoi]
MGAKLSRTLSIVGHEGGSDTESMGSTVVPAAVHRRGVFHSSHEGDIGNYFAPSAKEECAWARTGEHGHAHATRGPRPTRSTGRGGYGNFTQSPPHPRDAWYTVDYDRELAWACGQSDNVNAIRPFGRGGIGNMIRNPDYN